MKKLIVVSTILLLGAGSIAQPKIPASVRKAMDAIDTNKVREHITYLASDELRGRQPGTEGYAKAMDYVVNQFKMLGVKPIGENGTYLQKFILRRTSVKPGSVRFTLADPQGNVDSLQSLEIFAVGHPLKKTVQVQQAPLVFAGYGLNIPGVRNDYENIDVRGKVVVLLSQAPKTLSSIYINHFGSVTYKTKVAREQGAIGLITVDGTPGRVYLPGSNPRQPFMGLNLTNAVSPDQSLAAGRFTGELDFYLQASYNFLERLCMFSGKKADDVVASVQAGKLASFDLPYRMGISFESVHSDVETYNVLGMIPGTDARLKNEYVVHTAHLDHVGVGQPVNGDSIYNGAHDNASGTASLLEIARVYLKGNAKPKRSVIIAMVSAEELGLIGSNYFTAHPTVPRESIVANVNTDMPTFIAPLMSIVPLGADYSTMMKHVKFAASTLKLDIEADREPEQNFFVRSDQYSFVKEHIPAVNCKYGAKAVAGFDLDKYVKEWRAKYYHKPQDQIDGGVFLFSASKTYVQLNFLISYSVAMDNERPTWNEGVLF
jgi:hypothetical protein